MTGNAVPALEVVDLVTHFQQRRGFLRPAAPPVRAVDGVSFSIEEGRTLGLVGESGCGKSTTGRTIVRLVPATSGRIRLFGRDITELTGTQLREVRRDVQLVFQDPYSALDPRMTVGDIIAEPLRIHGLYEREGGPKRVRELLDLVGLEPDYADRRPKAFSGGQRQRVGIARALALRPRVLILDEPVSALDVSIQAQIVNLLQRLQAELGLAYLLIAHDLAAVRHVSDHVGVMYLGRIVEYGTRDEIFGAPSHPYTKALLSAVPDPDPELRDARSRIVLTGEVPNPAAPPSGCRFRTRCWLADDRCAAETPALVARGGVGHASACHYAEVGTTGGRSS